MKKLYKFRVRDQSMSWGFFWAEAIITVFILVNGYLNTLIYFGKQHHHRQLSGLRVATHMVK